MLGSHFKNVSKKTINSALFSQILSNRKSLIFISCAFVSQNKNFRRCCAICEVVWLNFAVLKLYSIAWRLALYENDFSYHLELFIFDVKFSENEYDIKYVFLSNFRQYGIWFSIFQCIELVYTGLQKIPRFPTSIIQQLIMMSTSIYSNEWWYRTMWQRQIRRKSKGTVKWFIIQSGKRNFLWKLLRKESICALTKFWFSWKSEPVLLVYLTL